MALGSVRVLQRVPQIVIVGGGFGGLQAARKLRHASAQVTLIDQSNHHLFQPLLYQVATAGLSPADIAAPIRGVLRSEKNVEVLLGEVVGVDRENRQVLLRDGMKVPFDYLVLATGSRHSYFNHPEWEETAPGLKSISDATAIRRKILLAFEAAEAETDREKRASLLTFVIVGGGPTGVELSGALSELSHHALARDFRHIDPKSTRIILIEAGPRILATFSEETAEKATRKLRSFGVEVRTGMRVEKVDADGVTVGGDRIAARTVLWAAGVVASPAAKWLGAEADRAGRVKVQNDLSVPGDSRIFVIGDAATLEQGGKPLPGVAPVALQQGKYVAELIACELKNSAKTPARIPFKYIDKGNLATVGRAFAVVEFKDGKIRGTGFFAWILWLLVHIYYLIGFRNRVVVLLEWAWAYITFQRGARLIVTETHIGSDEPRALGSPEGGLISGRGSGAGKSGGSRSG